MAKTKTSSEEIIEKKESSPVATASLILSCVAMIGAIVFCVVEITDYRTGLDARLEAEARPGEKTLQGDLRNLASRVDSILKDEPFDDEDGDDEEALEDEEMDDEGEPEEDEEMDDEGEFEEDEGIDDEGELEEDEEEDL